MINLLSKDRKKQIKAGHNNVFLIKTLIIVGSSITILLLLSVGSFIFLAAMGSTSSNQTANNSSEYDKLKKQIDTIKQDAQTIDSFLNTKISYSRLLIQLAKILGDNSLIKNISLNNQSSNQLTLKIYSKSDTESEILKSKFLESTIFTNFTINETKQEQTVVADYPLEITASVTINQDLLK